MESIVTTFIYSIYSLLRRNKLVHIINDFDISLEIYSIKQQFNREQI